MNTRLLKLSLISFCSILIFNAQAIRIYVKPDAATVVSGPWIEAKNFSFFVNNMQSSLQANDSVFFLQGIYTFASQAQIMQFSMPTKIYLLGGFAGYETSPEQRQIGKYHSVFDGDIKNSGIKEEYLSSLVQVANNANVTFDNFTFKNTYSADISSTIMGAQCVLEFVSCVFDNVSSKGAAAAIMIKTGNGDSKSDLKLNNCLIGKTNDSKYSMSVDYGSVMIVNSTVDMRPIVVKASEDYYNTIFYNEQNILIGDNVHSCLFADNVDVLIDPKNGDYQLKSQSVAVNAGNSDGIEGLVRYDLAGNPRQIGKSIDVGAFELQNKQGNAVNFDGSNYILSSSDPLLENDFTIEAWIKTEGNGYTILSNSDGVYDSYLSISTSDDKILATFNDNVGRDTIQSYSIVTDGKWHHFALTRKSEKISLYLDGKLSNQKMFSVKKISSSIQSILSVGTYYYKGESYQKFIGSIDELRVWNTARSFDQIFQHANDTITSPNKEENLVSYFQFEQLYGDTLFAEKGSNAKMYAESSITPSRSLAMLCPFVSASVSGADSTLLTWITIEDKLRYELRSNPDVTQVYSSEPIGTSDTSAYVKYTNWQDTVLYAQVTVTIDFEGETVESPIVRAPRKVSAKQNAFVFNGSTSLNLGNVDDKYNVSQCTIEFWIKPSETTDKQYLMYKFNTYGEPNAQASIDMQYNGANQSILFNGLETPAGSVPYNEWRHFAVTFDVDGQWADIYVNGELQSVSGKGVFYPHSSNDLLVGSSVLSYDNILYAGQLDELRIWNNIRLQDSIVKYIKSSLPYGGSTGLIANFKFDQTSGTSVIDSSGFMSNATINAESSDNPWVVSNAYLSPIVHKPSVLTSTSYTVDWDVVPGAIMYEVRNSGTDFVQQTSTDFSVLSLNEKTLDTVFVKAVFNTDKGIEYSTITSRKIRTLPAYTSFTPQNADVELDYDQNTVSIPVSVTGTGSVAGVVMSPFGSKKDFVVKSGQTSLDLSLNNTKSGTETVIWSSDEWSARLDSAKILHYVFDYETSADPLAVVQSSILNLSANYSSNEFGQWGLQMNSNLSSGHESSLSFDASLDTVSVSMRFSFDTLGANVRTDDSWNLFSLAATDRYIRAYYNCFSQELSVDFYANYSLSLQAKCNLVDGRTHSMTIVRAGTDVQLWLDGALLGAKGDANLKYSPNVLSYDYYMPFASNSDEYFNVPGTIYELYLSPQIVATNDIALLSREKKSQLTVSKAPKPLCQIVTPASIDINPVFYSSEGMKKQIFDIKNTGETSFEVTNLFAPEFECFVEPSSVSPSQAISANVKVKASELGTFKDTAILYTTATQLPNDKLHLYLSFDNTIAAQSSGAFASTIKNTSNFETGLNGQYYSILFDNYLSDYPSDVKIVDSVKKIESAYSIFFAIKNAKNGTVFSKGEKEKGGLFVSLMPSDDGSLKLISPYGDVKIENSEEWSVVTYVVDATGIAKAYLNGKLINEGKISGYTYLDDSNSDNIIEVRVLPNPLYYNTQNATIGSLNGQESYFSGQVDEFAIYNKALTFDEVLALNGMYRLPISATIVPADLVLAQSNDTAICDGANVALGVKTDEDAKNFAWYRVTIKDTVLIDKSETDTLTFSSVSVADSGRYFCVVSTEYGARDTSKTISLAVNERPVITVGKDTAGCDSVLIKPIVKSTLNYVTSVNGLKYNDFVNVKSTNSYKFVVTDDNNCLDSARLSVVISKSYFKQMTSVVACDSVLFGGKYITTTGIYYDSLQTKAGCDSIFKQQITINKSVVIKLKALVACDSALFRGKYVTHTGIYYDSLQTKAGCDSVFKQQITINKSVVNELKAIVVCDSTLFGGKYIIKSDTYFDTLQTKTGCDSVIKQYITVNKSKLIQMNDTVCSKYRFKNKILTQSGVYFDSLKTTYGCDSVIKLDLLVSSTLKTKPAGLFRSDKVLIQPSDTVIYSAVTQRTEEFSWVFEGGEPEISTDWSPKVVYNQPGKYITKLILHNCNGDSVITKQQVTVWAISPRSSNICKGQSVNLQVLGTGFSKYEWSTKETTPSIVVTPQATTTYKVTLTKGLIKIVDSVTITVNKVADLGVDTALCSGGSKMLHPGAFVSYYWNGSEEVGESKLLVNTLGTYSVRVVDADNCVSTDEMTVTAINPLPHLALGPDTSICWKAKLQLSAGNSLAQYQWNTGAKTATISVDTTGSYSVTVANEFNCQSVDTILVTARIPNAVPMGLVTRSDEGFNLIAWQRTKISDAAKFYVQRETNSPNVFVTIDTLLATDRSVVVDPMAKANSKQESYRLLTQDVCGNLSVPSPVHRSMYLAAFLESNGTVSVEWTKYVGRDVKKYIIYRAEKGQTLKYYDVVIPTSDQKQVYIDRNAIGLNSYYQVGFEIDTIYVDRVKSDSGPFSQSLSNMSEVSLVDLSTDDALGLVQILPNPASDKVTISVAKGVTIRTVRLQDELGRMVSQGNAVTSLDVSGLANGIYHVVVETDRGIIHSVITKQ